MELDIELAYPEAFIPWRATAFYDITASNNGRVGDPLRPCPGRPYSPHGFKQEELPYQRGNQITLLHNCASAGKVDTVKVWARIPGLAESAQPLGRSLQVQVPSCDAVHAQRGTLIDDQTNRAALAQHNEASTGAVSGRGCSTAPHVTAPIAAAISAFSLLRLAAARRFSVGRRLCPAR